MAKKLYVGNLAFNTNEEGLKTAFAEAGTVETVTIIRDRETERSRGFGFVEMANDEEAAKAIEMWNGKELDGRALTVNEARPMAEKRDSGFRPQFNNRH
jgi:RNA recognition motif-containing protein